MVAARSDEILNRAPFVAGFAFVSFLAWTAFLPPWNLLYVGSGLLVGAIVFGVLLFCYRVHAPWPWTMALSVFIGSQFFYPVALGEHASQTAGYLHHQLLAVATLFTLVALFRRTIRRLSGPKGAV
jgi:hypothetical protein